MFNSRMPNPQKKMVDVNDRTGNPSANKSQGTTFMIYDSLPLNGKESFKFFQGSKNRDFPLTNVDGTLQAGETTTILNAQILFVEYADPGAADPDFTVLSIQPLAASLQFPQGELDFMLSNSRTIKKMKLQTWVDKFNKNSQIADQNTYWFETPLTITSFLDFTANVTIPVGVSVANTYAQIIIEGAGGIYSAKGTV